MKEKDAGLEKGSHRPVQIEVVFSIQEIYLLREFSC
jgi:hypothetical protein